MEYYRYTPKNNKLLIIACSRITDIYGHCILIREVTGGRNPHVNMNIFIPWLLLRNFFKWQANLSTFSFKKSIRFKTSDYYIAILSICFVFMGLSIVIMCHLDQLSYLVQTKQQMTCMTCLVVYKTGTSLFEKLIAQSHRVVLCEAFYRANQKK